MSKLTQPMKLNNAILRLLLASDITNDEYMAIVRKLDALTSLALRAAPLDTELHNVLERRQDNKV